MPRMMKRLKGRVRQHMVGLTETGMNNRDLQSTMPWPVCVQRRFENGPVLI